MVPVGGSIVCSGDKKLIQALSTTYPGRASSAPVVDLFLTFLSLGKAGYTRLLAERKVCALLLPDQVLLQPNPQCFAGQLYILAREADGYSRTLGRTGVVHTWQPHLAM